MPKLYSNPANIQDAWLGGVTATAPSAKRAMLAAWVLSCFSNKLVTARYAATPNPSKQVLTCQHQKPTPTSVLTNSTVKDQQTTITIQMQSSNVRDLRTVAYGLYLVDAVGVREGIKFSVEPVQKVSNLSPEEDRKSIEPKASGFCSMAAVQMLEERGNSWVGVSYVLEVAL